MKNVSAGTIARTIILILALVNQVCAIMGWVSLDIADDQIYRLCSLAATVASALVSWWKNNSFTRAAIQADTVLKEIKEQL